MIDLATETVLPLSHVPRLPFVPRRRGKVHTATVYRWAQRGSGGIKLETMRTPGGLVTSEQAVVRFFEALSGVPAGQAPAAQAAATKAAEKAAQELMKMGA